MYLVVFLFISCIHYSYINFNLSPIVLHVKAVEDSKMIEAISVLTKSPSNSSWNNELDGVIGGKTIADQPEEKLSITSEQSATSSHPKPSKQRVSSGICHNAVCTYLCCCVTSCCIRRTCCSAMCTCGAVCTHHSAMCMWSVIYAHMFQYCVYNSWSFLHTLLCHMQHA